MAYGHDHLEETNERLFVLNGELRGVSVPLEAPALRIGSTSDCDVVLLDTDEDASEASVFKVKDGFAVGDTVGDVRVGRKMLKTGKRRALKSGVPFHVGGSDLMITRSLADADNAVNSHRLRSTRTACVASAAVLVGVIALVIFAGGRGSVIAKPAPLEVQNADQANSPSFMAMVAADAMRDRLQASGLSRLSATSDRANGTVKVRGKVRESEFGLWRDASEWFDTRYGDFVMLDAQVETAAETVTLPFSINAIWMGNSPRLTLHDGSQRFTGDLLPGGWRLDDIKQDSVTIWKDGESLMVPL